MVQHTYNIAVKRNKVIFRNTKNNTSSPSIPSVIKKTLVSVSYKFQLPLMGTFRNGQRIVERADNAIPVNAMYFRNINIMVKVIFPTLAGNKNYLIYCTAR